MWHKINETPEEYRKLLLKVMLSDNVVCFQGLYDGEEYLDWCGNGAKFNRCEVLEWRYLDELD